MTDAERFEHIKAWIAAGCIGGARYYDEFKFLLAQIDASHVRIDLLEGALWGCLAAVQNEEYGGDPIWVKLNIELLARPALYDSVPSNLVSTQEKLALAEEALDKAHLVVCNDDG